MFWYIMISLFLTGIYVLWNISAKSSRWYRTAIILMLIILWIFATFRSDEVGADTRNYLALMQQLKRMSLKEVFFAPIHGWNAGRIVDWEIGFKLIIWVFEKVFFFFPYRTGLSLISLLTCFFLYKAISSQSPYMFLSVWLYLTLGFYQTSLNMMQQGLALSIALWAIRFIREKKMAVWTMCIILSATIHLSVIFFLPIYWMSKIAFDWKKFILVLGAIGLLNFFSMTVVRFATQFIFIK